MLGGSLFYLDENIVNTFSCGLVIRTNNQVESLAMFLGSKMSSEVGVHSLTMFGTLFLLYHKPFKEKTSRIKFLAVSTRGF